MNSAAEQLVARRRIWQEKYAIRACYRGWHERIHPFIVPGRSLEVGAGSGDFRSFWPELTVTDIVPVPWLDVVADGMRLPVADGSLGNLLVIDLLHHLADPQLFFREVSRALRAGGRLLAIEPYITPLSYLGYRLMHHEDIWFRGYQKPAEERRPSHSGASATATGLAAQAREGRASCTSGGQDARPPNEPAAQARESEPDAQARDNAVVKEDPWQGNLALPNQLFGRERSAWPRRHPDLRIIHLRKFGLLDFQLAGGFKPFAFVARPRWYDFFQRLDRKLDVLGWLWGFRIFVVIEKLA